MNEIRGLFWAVRWQEESRRRWIEVQSGKFVVKFIFKPQISLEILESDVFRHMPKRDLLMQHEKENINKRIVRTEASKMFSGVMWHGEEYGLDCVGQCWIWNINSAEMNMISTFANSVAKPGFLTVDLTGHSGSHRHCERWMNSKIWQPCQLH